MTVKYQKIALISFLLFILPLNKIKAQENNKIIDIEDKGLEDIYEKPEYKIKKDIYYFEKRAINESAKYKIINKLNGEIEYLIITKDAFIDAILPLAEWKIQKGLLTGIFSLEWIDSNYSGQDTCEKIYNFLQSFYFNISSKKLKWVLLAGDSEIIPSKEYVINDPPENVDPMYLSDYYYAKLNTDDDWQADVYVGRIPVSNISDVISVINKILVYEKKSSH